MRCFGHKLPIGSSEGWFNVEDIGKYKNKICFELSMHGGIIYFAKDEITQKIYSLAKDIAEHYLDFKFKYFSTPADEPILALAMAVQNCVPVEWNLTSGKAYLFLPTALEYKCNILTGELLYTQDDHKWITDVCLMHWQNINTEKPVYRREIYRLNFRKDVSAIWYKMEELHYVIKTQLNRVTRKWKGKLK